MSEDFSDPKALKKLVSAIQKEGRQKGFTDGELAKRKNKHWDTVYKALAWGFIIFLFILGIWLIIFLALYTITLMNDPEDLKKAVETSVFALVVSAATLGVQKAIGSFLRKAT